MEYRIHKMAALALAGLLLAAPQLRADSSDDMEELRSTLGDLSANVNSISSIVNGIKWGGDFRYRYEHTDTKGGNINRERQRIRLRVKMDAKVNGWSKVKMQLATGGASATSTNLTLGDGFNNDPVSFDTAFLELNPDIFLHPVADFGKMVTPFEMAPGELIFDGDLTPEGYSLKLSQGLGPVSAKVIGASFQTGENGGNTLDPKLEGVQVILGTGLFGVDMKLAGLYLNGQNMGAEFDPDIVDGYFEASSKIMGLPVSAFYEYEKNTTAANDKEADAYCTGVSIKSGKLISYQSDFISLSYNYRSTKLNSTINAIDFSDFADGALDAWGNQTGVTLKVADNTTLGLTHIDSWLGASTVAAGGQAGFFELWQVDLVAKF